MTIKPIIALTGATGFLGNYVAKLLVSSGFEVTALIRDLSKAKALQDQGVKLISGDLFDASALEKLVANCDCVIHIAGAVKAKNADDLLRINAEGTSNLVAACAKNNPNIRLVHISSIAAREPQLSAYANSKAESETAAIAHKGPVVIVRPNAVYGPQDKEILQVFKVAKGPLHPVLVGKDSRIAMIHVEDAAKAIIAVCNKDAPTGTFEISDNRIEGYSWTEISKTAVNSVSGKYRPIFIPAWILLCAGFISGFIGRFRSQAVIFNLGKVREILHGDWSVQPDLQIPSAIWTAEIDLETGFAQTVNWYQEQGWL